MFRQRDIKIMTSMLPVIAAVAESGASDIFLADGAYRSSRHGSAMLETVGSRSLSSAYGIFEIGAVLAHGPTTVSVDDQAIGSPGARGTGQPQSRRGRRPMADRS